MDRGTLWATVHRISESDATAVTSHSTQENAGDQLRAVLLFLSKGPGLAMVCGNIVATVKSKSFPFK